MHDNLPDGAADNPCAPYNQSCDEPYRFFYICPNQFPADDERMVDDKQIDCWLEEDEARTAAKRLWEQLGYPVKISVYENTQNDTEGANFTDTITIGETK